MAAEATAIYQAAVNGGINPAFVLGLAGAESSYGKAGYAVGTHNPFGLGVHEGWTFPSYAAATSRLAQTLRSSSYTNLYRQSGIQGVINRYTPVGDASNNPTSHATNIRNMGARSGGDASVVYVGAGSPSGGATASAAGLPTTSGISVGPEFTNKVIGYFQKARNAIINNTDAPNPKTAFKEVIAAFPKGSSITQGAGIPSIGSSGAVSAAQSQLGVPYSWGGGNPSGPSTGIDRGASTVGFDCSSLVQYAWGKAGVKLPRTTYEQIHVGTAVPNLSQAQPGDLLFPSDHHVQMYLGNGKIIEAPFTGGQVRVTGVRSSGYMAIRRPSASAVLH
jgi:cell wall-associated NlpC family hydrolase